MKSVSSKVKNIDISLVYHKQSSYFSFTEFFKNEYLSALNKRSYIKQHYEFQNE